MSDIHCSLCGLQIPRRTVTMRCKLCSQLVEQARNKGNSKRSTISADVASAAIRRSVELRTALGDPDGYVCVYSGIVLATDKALFQRGDYVSFDHAVPNDGVRAELTCRIVNDLKAWMTDTEFTAFVIRELDVSTPRRIHGRAQAESMQFLELLQGVMSKRWKGPELLERRADLKKLAAGFSY